MILNIKDLTKIYDHQEVLKNFNLDIKKGEIYSLLGANGAGKTTTINIICGLLTYDSGEIKINDEKFNHKSKYLLGIAPQENILYSQLSCEENLSFFGKLYGLKGTKLKTAIYKSLQAVNLLEKKDQTVEILSGGMQRRLNIALALIHNPQLLILDEPTTGLDIESRYEIWQLIQSLKQEGITILLTTHFLDEAEKLSDRIGIMKEGKIIVEGTLTQLKETIPAKELIFVTTEEKEKAIEQGKKLGFSHRFYQGELAFLSDKSLELTEIIRLFEGINLSAITKKTIDLEHIYLQVTK